MLRVILCKEVQQCSSKDSENEGSKLVSKVVNIVQFKYLKNQTCEFVKVFPQYHRNTVLAHTCSITVYMVCCDCSRWVGG